MQGKKPLFDDLARVAGGAVSLMSTLRRQLESDIRERVASHLERMDMVSRTEFDHLQAQMTALRSENASLSARLDAIDGGKKKASSTSSKPKTKAKSKAKPTKTAAKSKKK